MHTHTHTQNQRQGWPGAGHACAGGKGEGAVGNHSQSLDSSDLRPASRPSSAPKPLVISADHFLFGGLSFPTCNVGHGIASLFSKLCCHPVAGRGTSLVDCDKQASEELTAHSRPLYCLVVFCVTVRVWEHHQTSFLSWSLSKNLRSHSARGLPAPLGHGSAREGPPASSSGVVLPGMGRAQPHTQQPSPSHHLLQVSQAVPFHNLASSLCSSCEPGVGRATLAGLCHQL